MTAEKPRRRLRMTMRDRRRRAAIAVLASSNDHADGLTADEVLAALLEVDGLGWHGLNDRERAVRAALGLGWQEGQVIRTARPGQPVRYRLRVGLELP